MGKVTSKDGATIAFDKIGKGPAVILVDGAMGYRALEFSGSLASLLSPHFTVISYDRRGRGESSDTKPYAVEREVEDIEALIDEAGGSACIYGLSSGAALAFEATTRLGNKIKRLAMYEAPYDSNKASRQAWREYWTQLNELVANGRRGDAVALFMVFVGMPAEAAAGMRQDPMWPILEAVAPTLIYDAKILGGEDRSAPVERAARITVPALVMDGELGFPFMKETASSLAKAMPNGQHRTLQGQDHNVDPKAIAPVLTEFFGK